MFDEEDSGVMCLPGQVPAAPASAADAVAMVAAGLGWLATTDVASLTTIEQTDCLRGLERASSMHIAARSRVLSAFHAQAGYEDDGQGSVRTWLKWQTRITGGAASQATARSATRWVPGRSPNPGRGRSPTGPTSCPPRCAATRMCSCWVR